MLKADWKPLGILDVGFSVKVESRCDMHKLVPFLPAVLILKAQELVSTGGASLLLSVCEAWESLSHPPNPYGLHG